MKTYHRKLAGAAAFLAVLAVAPALRAQTPTEGYDPMRQITAQLMKANLHIVQDVTGSMEWFPDSTTTPSRGANSFGYLSESQVGYSGQDSTCGWVSNKWQCRYWYYNLSFEGPSRMAIVKNALGAAVPLVTSYTPPAVALPWSLNSTNPNTASQKTWYFRYDYGQGKVGLAPQAPFATPYGSINIAGTSPVYTVDHFPTVVDGACTIGTCNYVPPQNLIGKNASRINWGLTKFSTDGTRTLIYIDTSDANSQLVKLQDYFLPVGAVGQSGTGGLTASGSTPTRAALAEAQKALVITANADPKVTKQCNRPYGVVLVTDGLSNSGNSDDGHNWLKPCNVGGPTSCDSAGGDYDCPSTWSKFAAYYSDQLFTTTTSSTGAKVPVRTWTIGVSTAVGPCELDYIAYMGRTDASSPVGDAGWSGYDSVKNPFLPNPANTEPSDPRTNYTQSTYDGPTGQYYWNKDTTISGTQRSSYSYDYTDAVTDGKTFDAKVASKESHGHNAFFATSAEKLGDALATIVNATATGDYATSAPVSGTAASLSTMVYLPSTGFPNFDGHIYAFDTTLKPTDAGYVKWDAGVVMNGADASTRKIFTWDPSNSNALVEVTVGNISTLQAVGGASVTNAVVDFIRGNDGAGSPRTWRLGPMINSAPALVGPPALFLQGTVLNHKPFESTYMHREALLWVGSNDGMMHAFRISDGVEQIALVPPGLLATQALLYDNYLKDKRTPKNQAGEPVDTDNHLYGVANSFRFGDVWDSTVTSFRTVGIITLGPGGDDIIAVDVTNVPAPGASPYPTAPVKVLWTKDSTALAGLQQTWSIPAVAPADGDTWRLVVGSGFTPLNTATAQKTGANTFTQPEAFTLDPVDGSLLATSTLTSSNSPIPLVGNQAFADAVLFDPMAKVYQDDNIARLGLQADLNGRIWFLYNTGNKITFDTAVVGIDASAKVAASQPIYYNPAASGYGVAGAGCVAYAFGSGTLYERSAAVTGASSTFVPRLFVATNLKANMTSAVPAANIQGRPIAGSWCVSKCDSTDPATPPVFKTFGPRTQLTAPPFMLVPRSGTGSLTALFLLYDPDEGCYGNSYVAIVEFEGSSTCAPAGITYKAFDAGRGAASGFTIADNRVLVSQSGVGQGQRAGIFEPPDIAASIGGPPQPKVRWWKELK